MLRDTETEQLLRDYTRPILRVAGLEKQNIQVVIINDSVFNAFVADGRRIFVNYGAMMQSETPNQLIGVLAHETGHLAGGHLAKLREQLAQAQTQMIIAMLLGAGALVAGAQKRQQQWRPDQCRRGRDLRAAGNDPAHPALLSAPAGGKRRPRRREVLDRDRPIRRRACTTPSSASAMTACSPRTARIPICSRIRCPPSASPRWRKWRVPAPIGTRRTIRPCKRATT